MNHLVFITKSDGTRELFEEEKLVSSLQRVGASAEAIDDIIEQIGNEIRDGMSTSDIYARAFALLRKHSVPTAVKYSIRRALMELGPDGFPFERFVARIFKKWGYEAVTDQILRGQCVDHEVDVVAWKNSDPKNGLAMVEAKFHNEFGLKSDLKVALYVKARFDDLTGVEFDYGGKRRKLTEPWLITNTKFTDKAIIYGKCHNMKLVGWNYPERGSMHEIIEENGMHPITSMTTLSHEQKKNLIGRNILVCADLAGNLAILKEIGVKPEEVAKILNEAKIIIETAK